MISKARALGITVKGIAEIANINVDTLYNYNCGRRKLSQQKQNRLRAALNRFIYSFYFE